MLAIWVAFWASIPIGIGAAVLYFYPQMTERLLVNLGIIHPGEKPQDRV